MARPSQQASAQSATLDFFRDAVADLLDSFDARVVVDRAEEPDGATEEQRDAAARLSERLGKTNRLAKGKFVGPDRVTAAMTQFSDSANRLDAAFVLYRRSSKGTADDRARGATTFQEEISQVRASLNLTDASGADANGAPSVGDGGKSVGDGGKSVGDGGKG